MGEVVRKKLVERLEMYQDMMVENKALFDQLLVQMSADTIDLDIDRALLSRLDDITEDIVTLNVDIKNVLPASSLSLSLSPREPERNAFYRQLKTFLPMLFFWHYHQII